MSHQETSGFWIWFERLAGITTVTIIVAITMVCSHHAPKPKPKPADPPFTEYIINVGCSTYRTGSYTITPQGYLEFDAWGADVGHSAGSGIGADGYYTSRSGHVVITSLVGVNIYSHTVTP